MTLFIISFAVIILLVVLMSLILKNAVKEGLFNEQWLLEILSYKKPPVRKVVFNQNKLDSYFEPNMTNEDIEGIIVKLLEEWKAKGGQD